MHTTAWERHWGCNETLKCGFIIEQKVSTTQVYPNYALQARIQKKLDEELPQEQMVGIKLGAKVSGNQGLSKSQWSPLGRKIGSKLALVNKIF